MKFSPEHGSNGHQRMRQRLLNGTRACVFVLSILLAATYLRVLRPPLPLGGNDGNANPRCSYLRTIFFSFNAFTFYFAACGLVLAVPFSVFAFVLVPAPDSISREQEVDAHMKVRAIMIIGSLYLAMFLALALTSWAIAFLFSGLVTVSQGGFSETLSVIIPCAVGIFVLFQALFILARKMVHFLNGIRASDEQLWTAVKSETIHGKVLNWYMELLDRRGFV